jgi:hypothetical protein
MGPYLLADKQRKDVQRFDRAVEAAREELDGKMLADMTAFIEITVEWKRNPAAFSKGAYLDEEPD